MQNKTAYRAYDAEVSLARLQKHCDEFWPNISSDRDRSDIFLSSFALGAACMLRQSGLPTLY
jgi:hypothetical protein